MSLSTTDRQSGPARTWPTARPADAVLRLVFDPVGPDRDAAVDCEADVFFDRYGESREMLTEFFQPHEAATTWLAVVDAEGTAVASARLVLPSAAPLNWDLCVSGAPWHLDPSEALAACGVDRSSTWDVATISVRRRSRGEGALWTAALCHGLFEVSRENEVSATVAVLNEPARQRLDSMGIIYSTVPGAATHPFLGSPASTPVFADMAALVANQRRHFPEAHRLVTLGKGLDGVHVPPAAELRLRPRAAVDLRPVDLDRRSVLGLSELSPS